MALTRQLLNGVNNAPGSGQCDAVCDGTRCAVALALNARRLRRTAAIGELHCFVPDSEHLRQRCGHGHAERSDPHRYEALFARACAPRTIQLIEKVRSSRGFNAARALGFVFRNSRWHCDSQQRCAWRGMDSSLLCSHPAPCRAIRHAEDIWRADLWLIIREMNRRARRGCAAVATSSACEATRSSHSRGGERRILNATARRSRKTHNASNGLEDAYDP